jgi:hypothetical protein
MNNKDNWPICENVDEALLLVNLSTQKLFCSYQQQIFAEFLVSTGKNGPGEEENSGCTPRGLHEIADIIGNDCKKNAVFIGRQWTGEIYSLLLDEKFPQRDWILSRILRLRGLEEGFNLGPGIDTFSRYIYIHGTPDKEGIGLPNSHGCIRMRNNDVIKLSNWIKIGVKVLIVPECTSIPEKIESIGVKNNE